MGGWKPGFEQNPAGSTPRTTPHPRAGRLRPLPQHPATHHLQGSQEGEGLLQRPEGARRGQLWTNEKRERKGEREAGAGARLRSRGSPAPAALPGPVLPGSRGPWLCSVSSRTVPFPGKFGGRRGVVLGAQSPLSGGEEERGRSGRVRAGPWGSGVPRSGSVLCAPRSPRAGASGAAGAGRRAGREGLRGGGGEGGRPPPGEGCHWPAASSGGGRGGGRGRTANRCRLRPARPRAPGKLWGLG